MKLIESETFNNLAKAYAGECQARTRYEFIEYGARQQGYKRIADIVDKIVYNEFNHARMFYTKIQDASKEEIKNIEICAGYPFKEKWDLVENFRIAVEDEKAEVELYPKFAKVAEEEGFLEIATLFTNTASVEVNHMNIFNEIYTQLKDGTLYKKEKEVLWKCGDCGYEGRQAEAYQECPLCKAKQGAFNLILKSL